MTSSTVASPSSSATLIEIRFASGATPTYLPCSGSEAGRLLPLPAMIPATCVPWPYSSLALVAPGLIDAVATTREVRVRLRLAEVRQVAGDAGVDHGDADALAGGAVPRFQASGAPVTRVGGLQLGVVEVAALASRPRSGDGADAGCCLARLAAALAELVAAKPLMIGRSPVDAAAASRTCVLTASARSCPRRAAR